MRSLAAPGRRSRLAYHSLVFVFSGVIVSTSSVLAAVLGASHRCLAPEAIEFYLRIVLFHGALQTLDAFASSAAGADFFVRALLAAPVWVCAYGIRRTGALSAPLLVSLAANGLASVLDARTRLCPAARRHPFARFAVLVAGLYAGYAPLFVHTVVSSPLAPLLQPYAFAALSLYFPALQAALYRQRLSAAS